MLSVTLLSLLLCATLSRAQHQAWWGAEFGREMQKARDCLPSEAQARFDDWFKLVNETHTLSTMQAQALHTMAQGLQHRQYCDVAMHALHSLHAWLRAQLQQERYANEQFGMRATLTYLAALRHDVRPVCERAPRVDPKAVARCMSEARKQAMARLAVHRVGA